MTGGRLIGSLGLLAACSCGQIPKDGAQVPGQTRGDTALVREVATPAEGMQADGVYFKAAGTEPFWGLEIGPASIRLMTLGDTLTTPHAEPVQAADANVKRYDLATEASILQIEIAQGDCTNDMSGEKSPYSVRIAYRRTAVPELMEVEGCGRYVPDYRLHDIWVLESIRGTAVSATEYPADLPTLEIRAGEQTYSGTTGCNRMMGSFFWEPGTLRFGPAAVTRMACPGMGNREQEFLSALAAGTTYTIGDNRLRLSNPDQEVLVFRKID